MFVNFFYDMCLLNIFSDFLLQTINFAQAKKSQNLQLHVHVFHPYCTFPDLQYFLPLIESLISKGYL